MNFYLAVVDGLLRHPTDQPSIGLILCKTRNQVIAEYALRDQRAPIGVATYEYTAAVPDALKDSLPEIPDLQARVASEDS